MILSCALPLFAPLLSEGGLFAAGPILPQPLKLMEKFLLGILDPAPSSAQPLPASLVVRVGPERQNSSGVLKVVKSVFIYISRCLRDSVRIGVYQETQLDV